jgi:spore coat polysaccharide biosynthesis predicted glycosyltransferase SpsG
MNVVFLTEGGGDLGLGHVMRSLTLARKFVLSNVKFVLTPRSTDIAKLLIRGEGFRVSQYYGNVDLVIRDLSEGAKPEHAVPGKIMIDIADEAHEISLDTTYGFSFMGDTFPFESIFSGFDFAILRDAFFLLRKNGPSKKTGPIVVSLGGVDPSGATPVVLEGLKGLAALQGRGLVGVVGPGYKGAWVEGMRPCAPAILAEYLYQAPLVVSSGGMTALECACLGTPTLVVAHNEKEDRRAKLFSSLGFCYYVGKANTLSLDIDLLKWHANHILTGRAYASTMQSIGWAMVDGRGAERVISFINNNIGNI